ncbi:magnesium/cobalt transporter CorA [Fundidesulfovibrio butyratiphilus]
MFERLRQRAKTAHHAHSAPLYSGSETSGSPRVTMLRYDSTGSELIAPVHAPDCVGYADSSRVTWVDVAGLADAGFMAKVGETFHIHPLVLEDIVHTTQRPKLDELDDAIFVVARLLRYDDKTRRIEDEQVSFLLGKNYLLSFRERQGEGLFDAVRRRIQSQKGRAWKLGPDFLLYVLLDSVVDNYFLALERMGDEIEDVEEMLLTAPKPVELQRIHDLRREALFLRKFVWPLREVLSGLEKGGSDLIADGTIFYLRDLYDHTIQVMDTIETFRDMLSGMLDLYLSNISLKMNEVMKVLTMFSTLFIPLTFLAGVYGMNFKNMPELEWHDGYFMLLGFMVAIAGGMLLFFRRKGWIGRNDDSEEDSQ